MIKNKYLKIYTVLIALFLLNGCKAPYPFMDKGELYYPPYKNLTPDQMRQRDYLMENPKTDSRTKNAILSGSIFIGMSQDQVFASWGKPDHKSNTKTPRGFISQWIYESGDYLYFLNDVLYDNKKKLN